MISVTKLQTVPDTAKPVQLSAFADGDLQVAVAFVTIFFKKRRLSGCSAASGGGVVIISGFPGFSAP